MLKSHIKSIINKILLIFKIFNFLINLSILFQGCLLNKHCSSLLYKDINIKKNIYLILILSNEIF